MPIWPGRGGDEGEEGKYSDIARSEEPRGRGRPPVVGDTVKDILHHADPIRGLRPIEIAEELGRRVNPTEPFKGKNKRALQSSVKSALRILNEKGEVENRQQRRGSAPTFWTLVSGPQGGPKRSDWDASGRPGQGRRTDLEAHPMAKGRVIKDPKRIEPGRGGDPATWGEADKLRERRRQRNIQRRTDDPSTWTPEKEEKRQTAGYRERTADPMTWGIKPEVRDEDLKGRTSDPMTWGKSDPEPPKGGKTADPMTWGKNDPPPDDNGGNDNGGGLGFFKKV